MTKRVSFLLCLLFLLPFAVHSQGSDTSIEKVDAFNAQVTLSAQGSMTVVETIQYDFGTNDRHGIFRYLPYKYTRNGYAYNLRYTVNSVTDENGVAYEYTEKKSNGNVVLTIGDPNSLVFGKKTYVLRYTVDRAVNFFSDHDELYWNATGNGWQVPIDRVSVKVIFPSTERSTIKHVCYTGALGSVASNCIATVVSDQEISVESQSALGYGEGLSFVLGLPPGTIARPSTFQNARLFLIDNWVFALPIVAFIFLHILWLKKGRDPKVPGTIVPQYEPPDNMPPAVMGTLWDEKADTRDVSAEIIYLATRGYIKIKDIGDKDYQLTLLNNDTSGLDSIDRGLIEAMFSSEGGVVKLSSLKNKFYTDLAVIQKKIYDTLVTSGYYAQNPHTVRAKYIGVGIVLAAILFSLGGGFGSIAWIAGVLTAILIIVYGLIMPKKTLHGAQVKENIQGFKWFLSVTEEERIKFHNAPEKKPEQFEKFLPYAMVLGVEKQWAGQFADLYRQPPGWYEGNFSTFSALVFVSALSNMNTNMTSTLSSRPSSAGGGSSGFGGGGFSGGGFGGGGGGSW